MQLRLILTFVFITNLIFAQNYHDSNGKLEISNGGQANYTIPIAMPPSINSIGPTINLSYSSGAASGIAGQGWSINSISNISRISNRLDIEGYRDGVNFNQDDKLSFDGQYLLLKSGNYWESGSVYQTEVQSNLKIELFGSGLNMYFVVTNPDGSRSWYGNNNAEVASDLTAFFISKYEDTNGNVITYKYMSGINALYISEINFSANINTNTTPLNKILFTYKNAQRKESLFIKGQEVKYDKILDKVEVFTNNLLFKKYQLTHNVDENGYERVTQFQEFNSNNEAANPVFFEYENTTYSVTEFQKNYGGGFSSTFNHVTSGDFDGDGRLDFVNATQIYLNAFSPTRNYYINDNVINLPITLSKGKTFPISTLHDNKLRQAQSILKIEENLGSVDLKIYGLEDNVLQLLSSKNIILNNIISVCEDNCNPSFEDINGNNIPNPNSKCNNLLPTKSTNTNYLEGDFNGDSISELLIIDFNEKRTFNFSLDDCKPKVEILNVEELRIVDLNTNNPSLLNTIGNFKIQSSYIDFLYQSKYFIADFNADGKSDLQVMKPNGEYKVFTFIENPILQTVTLEIIGQGIISDYNLTKQVLFGDFNGDSKTDVLLPVANNNGCIECVDWSIYYSNPKIDNSEMFTKATKPIVQYWPSSGDYYDTQFYFNQYYATDINKDGKTDLMRLRLWNYQPNPFWDDKDWDSKWQIEAYMNNLDYNGQFNNMFISSEHESNDPGLPLPIVANFEYNGGGRYDKVSADIAVLRWDGILEYLDVNKDFSKDNLLKKISQSNNAIIDEIQYEKINLPSTNNGFGLGSDIYSSSNQFDFPLVEFKQMPAYSVVKKLKNTSGGSSKYQLFKYQGLTYDLKGIGLIGFKKVARSNWFLNDSDNKIWIESITEPLKRGALVSTTTFKPSQNFSFSTTNPLSSTIINKVEFDFQQTNATNTYPYVLLKTKEKSTDFISGVVNETNYFYTSDNFNLLNKSISRYYTTSSATIQGSKQIETIFENNPLGVGANYYIGRPLEIITTNKVFVNTIINNTTDNSNTQTSSEKLYYTNNNLTKLEKSSNNSTVKIIEDYSYFTNGLLQSKTLSAIGTDSNTAVTPISTEYTYDPTNRFVKTTKNVNDNLTITNNTYHPIYGMVTSSTNALGQITTSTYDNWGKRTKVTDFLNKSISYSYTRTGNLYTTIEVSDDGSENVIEQDELAREIRKGSKDINANWNFVKTEYDAYGKKFRVSEPYSASSSPSQWSVIEYDDLSRPIKTTSHTGKIVNTIYSSNSTGSIVAANEPLMSKTKYMNANGFIYSAIDNPGGTINYKYDANGNLLESDYEGIKTKIEYDDWGRKTKLDDTSAGVYTYSYDAFGKSKIETTPKGSITYTYDAGGRIATKVLAGSTTADATNMTATYSYHPTFKWITNLSIVNSIDGNSSYDYSYDSSTKQVNQTVEKLFNLGSSTPVATFTKSVTFDSFGRIDTETSIADSYGKTSSKTIKHTYKNGAEWQLLDGTTIISQANTVNSRGQLLTAQFGNGITISNTYDSFGYLSQQKHDLGTTNMMTLSNQFEPILGNLTTRSNSLFDTREKFEYDNLDRLIKWDGSATSILNLPFNTTTDGFTFTSTSVNGSVTNSSGTLKINLKNASDPDFPIAAQRILPATIISGDKIRFKATITNKVATAAIVKAIMVEQDPLDSANYIEYEIGTIENGLFDVDYTVSNFVTNPILKFRFIVVSTGASNGGGLIIPTTTFYVDNFKVDKIAQFSQNYDNRGRITDNTIGTYKYEIANKPYQNSKVKLTPQGQTYFTSPNNTLDVKYNMFASPYKIAMIGKDNIDLSYNILEQRSIMYWGNTNTDKTQRPFRRYYSADGSMEVTANFINNNFTTPSSVEIITFVDGTAYDAAIVVKNTYTGTATTPTGSLFYLHRDYQGSIVAITNATGALVEKRQFDPWGAIVKVQNGAGTNLTKLTFFDRGYTGHEHLESVGLINMNGRVYDPVLHRFLQADSMVQEPYNTQNYNRYGYCLNNPLKYTDVSGEDFGLTFAISMGVALAVYFGDTIINDKPVTFRGIASTVVVTAVSAGFSYGIGTAATHINNFFVRASAQALAHGITQGGMTALQGGKFWSGFAAGAVSSIMSSVWQGGQSEWQNPFTGEKHTYTAFKGLGNGFTNKTVGTMFFGTISGAAAAAVSGGNFWQGAVSGLIVSGLNHVAHSMMWEDPIKQPWDTNGDGKLQKSEADNWWLNGKGKPITVDNRLIDWSGLDVDKIDALKVGSSFSIETHEAFMDLEYETAATYGGTSFIKTGQFIIEVQDQKYHYDYRPNNSPKNIIRNIMTRIGKPVGQMPGTGALYTGQDYKIHYANRSISVFDLR